MKRGKKSGKIRRKETKGTEKPWAGGRDLEADMARLGKMAFGRARHCGPLVKAFHELNQEIAATGRGELIWRVYDWLLVPFSLWPEDFESMGAHVLRSVESKVLSLRSADGKRVEVLDEDMICFLEMLPETPTAEAQEVIERFELDVESGRYNKLLKQWAKYEEQERALLQNKELMGTWARIKERFDVTKFQRRGVIRRRVSGERNFREGWQFDWSSKRSRFQHMFDAMCYQWNLYGMEYDRPLLLKLTANPTPHGTLVMIPRHINFDYYRDVNWKLITELHRARSAGRQGPKLSVGRNEKVGEATRAKRLWDEAGKMGIKGEARYDYVRERMGKDVRADKAWLWRLLKLVEG